jgi:hypothetical protein
MHSAHLRSYIYLVASVYVVTTEKEHVNFHSDTTRALNNLRWDLGGYVNFTVSPLGHVNIYADANGAHKISLRYHY